MFQAKRIGLTIITLLNVGLLRIQENVRRNKLGLGPALIGLFWGASLPKHHILRPPGHNDVEH